MDKFEIFKNNKEVFVDINVDNKFSLKEKRAPIWALFKIRIALPTPRKVIQALD